MSDRTDLERDIAEEDELRRLLTHGDRDLVAPRFADVLQAAARGRSRLMPGLAAVAAAMVLVIVGIGVVSVREPSPASTPFPSIGPTASPQVAIPPVGERPAESVSICPEPPRPAYLPFESSETQTTSQLDRIESRFLGPGAGVTRPEVRVALQASADDLPKHAPRRIGNREVITYSTPSLYSGTAPFVPGQPSPSPSLTLQQPAEARAWWREPSGDCPVVTVALVWPDDGSERTDEDALARVIQSIPAIPVAAAATAAPADQYGLIGRRCCGLIDVLRESNAENLGGIYTTIGFFDISPDGREIAFWDQRELWIAPASAPTSVTKLLTLSSEHAAGVVWSTDGKELLIAVGSTTSTPGPGPQPIWTALRVVGRDGSGLRELARIETGQTVRPLAWDPSRGMGAAVEYLGEKGPGRYILVADHPVVSGSTESNVRFMDLPDARDAQVGIGELEVSEGARFVMATWNYGGRDLIRVWPLEGIDIGRTRELTPSTPGETIRGALWRPRTFEIGVNVSGNFELWTLDGQRRRVRSFGASAVAFLFRYDGTALYSAAMSSGRLELTDLDSGKVSELPSNLGDGSASVRLGP